MVDGQTRDEGRSLNRFSGQRDPIPPAYNLSYRTSDAFDM